MPTLAEAIEYIRMGDQEQGRLILEEILEEDENNEEVWLWLSSVVESDEDREICLENVLALNPNNEVAKKGLEALRTGTFNISQLLGDTIEDEFEEEEPRHGSTFIDDFLVADDEDFDDDDLVFPGSGSKSKTKTKAKAKGGGLNVKAIILGVLVLVLVLVLGGVGAAYYFFIGGAGSGGSDNTPPVESPAIQETPSVTQEAPPTDTPTPVAPTDTPTATSTSSLQLPTAAPTFTPSPTSTTVVSPTPNR